MFGPPTPRQDAEYTAFVRSASGSLTRTAWLLTGDADLAAELVQEALVKTYLAWRRVRHGEATAYARRVLVNLNIDRWRRRPPTPSDDLDKAVASDAEQVIDDRDEVVRMLATLPPQQRRVIVLRYYNDLVRGGRGRSPRHQRRRGEVRGLTRAGHPANPVRPGSRRRTVMNDLEERLRSDLQAAAAQVEDRIDADDALLAGQRARSSRRIARTVGVAALAAVAGLVGWGAPERRARPRWAPGSDGHHLGRARASRPRPASPPYVPTDPMSATFDLGGKINGQVPTLRLRRGRR